ncbi:MAG: phosphotransferase, partial [Saprospiraceae bacterium]|nr:phosphotransferase [Saprospiraceae bacterium]
DKLDNLIFPSYYPELSSERILVMDWVEGQLLREWIRTGPDMESRNKIGQSLWDFYAHQIHTLKMVHADPHPGNFIITPDQNLGVIDFGCVKVIPEDFYDLYFQLMTSEVMQVDYDLHDLFLNLGFLAPSDSKEERTFFIGIFTEMIELLGRPFRSDQFDFADEKYFKNIYTLGERISKMKEIRNSKVARGNKHAIYINRTYFGLYNLLHELKAKVNTSK